MIITKPFAQKPQQTTLASTDSADKHTYPFGPDEYFTGFIVNRDATNLLDVLITSDGFEVPMPLLPKGVLNFKNQKMSSFRITVDPSNASASGILYQIEGKVHKPTTDTERMFLESDSEFFFRFIGVGIGSGGGAADYVAWWSGASSLAKQSSGGWSMRQDVGGNLGIFKGATEIDAIEPGGSIFLQNGGSLNFTSFPGLANDAANDLVLGTAAGGVFAFVVGNNVNVSVVDNNGKFSKYNNLSTAWLGVSPIFGTPDYRTGLAASDGAPTTIYTTINATSAFRLHARVFSTVFGANSTYVIKWTEGGVVQTVTLTSTAANNAGAAYLNQLIQPDAGTAITVQFAVGAGSTCNVMGEVEEVK